MGSSAMGGPIKINLDGKFVIPRKGVPHIVGEINPDLRLEHLDAFLSQLNQLMKTDNEDRDTLGNTSIPQQLDDAFARIISDAAKRIKMETNAVRCVLSVDCELDTTSNRMTYRFAVTGELT